MSIDRLHYFAAVVETRNLRKAAELVGISPPSMSKAISVLESELNAKLIHPEGRGIGITRRGLEIYRLSASLLEEHRRFHQQLRAGETHGQKMRFATFEVFSTYFLSAFLALEKYSDLLLLEMTPGKIERAILDGIVDFGLTYLPSPHPTLDYVEVGAFEMGIFGQARWRDLPFERWPFAIPTTELRLHSSEIEALDLWPGSAPKRNVKYRFELLETALLTTRKGLSVLHCPEFIARLQNEEVKPQLQLVALKNPSGYKPLKPTQVFLVGRKGEVPPELERKLAKFMRSIR